MENTMYKDDINVRNSTGTKQFCTFWLSGRLFGINIFDLKEINRELNFTPIFHAPDAVKGYVNIRGQIHLVLDLSVLLGFKAKETDDDSCMLIFKQSVAEPFGILVDKIGDVVYVDENKIEDRRTSNEYFLDDIDSRIITDDFINGVCKLDDNLLVVLNPIKLLAAINVSS